MTTLYGGIEAGGTKFVCTVAAGKDRILAEERFPTTTPDETLGRAVSFFKEQQRIHALQAIGVAAFGPIDPDPDSPTYGYITTTPKPGWAQTDVVGTLRDGLGIPVAFDTDVNGAALGEHRWGAAQGLNTFIYLTIGTGVGGGGMVGGKLMHGLVHPEMGHILLPRRWDDDSFGGICPFHGDCLEGLAAGPAIEARWGVPATQLGPQHRAWEIEAEYISLALASLVCILSPQRIILGGGVMHQYHLFPRIRERVLVHLNGYVQATALLDQTDRYIVPPGLGDQAGMLGAIALAQALGG